MSEQIITKEGYEKLEKEFNHLKNVKRPEIAERIER
ncbi:transcription elongation factor GreA, partial [Candidatus Falkowbacteria bacterium]